MTTTDADRILECMAIDMTGALAGLSQKNSMADLLSQRIDAINVARSALRKQQPRNPDRPRRYAMGNEYDDFRCHCGRWLCYEPEMDTFKDNMLFCQTCGQKIAWPEK